MDNKKNTADSYLLKYGLGDGKTFKVRLSVAYYLNNNNLAVSLVAKNGDSYDVTVNIDYLPPMWAAVNNYGPGQQHIIEFLESNDIASYTGFALKSGFVTCPVYQFSRDVLLLHDPVGLAKYEKQISGGAVEEEKSPRPRQD